MKLRLLAYPFLISPLPSLFLFAPLAFGECEPEQDGDCCTKDSDCIAYVYENLCAIMALNKIAVAKLERTPPTLLQMCTAEKLAKLRKEAAAKKPTCEDEVCRWEVEEN
jgi:hypothetical protein